LKKKNKKGIRISSEEEKEMEKNSERNPLSKQKQEKKGMKNRYADRN